MRMAMLGRIEFLRMCVGGEAIMTMWICYGHSEDCGQDDSVSDERMRNGRAGGVTRTETGLGNTMPPT